MDNTKVKNILILVIGSTGNEPEALRQSLEYFGYFVAVKYIGRPNDLISVLKGDLPFETDCIILSCHGENGEMLMPVLGDDVYEAVEIEAKYSGYIKRQMADIEVFKKDEKLKIKEDIDYHKIGGLSNEMIAKLSKVRPSTIGEASRISGVTPAAIMAILGYIKK